MSELKDQKARESIINDLDTNILVEAGAGSGKTRSLVERMVVLIREGKCQINRLAAVTFTRKAAAELKERFQLMLEKALVQEAESRRKKYLMAALERVDQCFVGTIHSFSAAMLRELPVEAGLDPDFTEMEEMEDRLFMEEAWQDYLVAVRKKSPDILREINEEMDVDVRDLKGFYRTLVNYPDINVVYKNLLKPDFNLTLESVHEFLDEIKKILPSQIPPKGWDDLQKLLRKALYYRSIFNLNDQRYLIRLLALLDKRPRVVQNRWPCKENAQKAKIAFEIFHEQTVIPALKSWREYRYGPLVEFVLPAAKYYEQIRLSKARLNFQDLLMKASALLKNNPQARNYFQKHYTHILIDEFQDTDPVQAEIIFYLTGEDTYEQNWRRLIPRPGSLFVVGDPKQSIYRFRRADIDTYNEVKRLILQSGGRVLYLTSNFRSAQAVVSWVNSTFKELLPQKSTACQAAFTSMDPVRPDYQGTAQGVRKITIPKVKGNKQEDIVSYDAERIACWIRWALDGNIKLFRESGEVDTPRPADFMILLRYKSRMDIYARKLEKYGIPYIIAGGEGLSESVETQETLKLLKALVEPDNQVILVAVLRGIFFGISDNQLWRFKKAGGCFNFYSAVPDSLSKEDEEVFKWAFNKMKMFHEWVKGLPATVALEKILTEIGVVPYILTGQARKSRCGYIIQSLEFLKKAENKGMTSFSSLVRYMALLMESGVEDEINIIPWEEDAVRIMNLHKAKGLEAPVVFLANPGKNVRRTPQVYISRIEEPPGGYFLIKGEREIFAQPENWGEYAAIEEQYLQAEEIRLLYVAATRAKNLLVVSAYPEKPQASPWNPFNAFLECIEELEEHTFPDLQGTINKPGKTITQNDLEEARRSFLAHKRMINRPSYHLVTVTDLLKQKGQLPVRQVTGRGSSWGRVIHRILEACCKKMQELGKDDFLLAYRSHFLPFTSQLPSNLDLFILNIMAEEGRAPEEKEEIIFLIRDILASPLWQRVIKSKKHYTEVPFSVKVEDKILSGAIDLVFLEDAGWVIVEYKTDTVLDNQHLESLVSFYAPQVNLYRTFWEKITGTPVKEAGIYFTHNKLWKLIF